MTPATNSLPVFHTLISEKFFLDKVEPAIQALGWQPVAPDWEQAILPQIAANPGLGVVLDLEEDTVDMLVLIKELQENHQTAAIPILGYSSHEREDLIEAATAAGITVVQRSIFAANLVRVLMELVGYDPIADRNGGAS
ncbi:MAG: hypothetical protein COB96_04840 [Planctomycetota bacterium]|nr:MAG: hypothetical protein COB96_04840 [Planctomycetota bacterium]